jgi:hypothetical protein
MSRARAKGTYFESLTLEAFQEYWPDEEGALVRGAHRIGVQGAHDKGDLRVPAPYVVECKNEKAMDLSGWLREAEQEAENAHKPYGIVVHKRRAHGAPGAQYVTVTLNTWLRMVHGDPVHDG